MSDDSMRAKARAAFGKEFMAAAAPQGYAKNAAVALQQRANARPIPTYKVGGVVKKDPYGGDRTPSTKVPAPRPSVEGPDIKAGQMKSRATPGADKKLKAAQDRASALGLKDGGKASKKPGLAIMIAVGKTKPVKKAEGGLLEALGITKKKPDNMDALKESLKSSGESGMKGIREDMASAARESIGTQTAARAQPEIPTGGKQTFGEAFKAARAGGDKTFTFGGKSYTTKVAGEGMPTRKAIKTAAPAARPTERAAVAEAPAVRPTVSVTTPRVAANRPAVAAGRAAATKVAAKPDAATARRERFASLFGMDEKSMAEKRAARAEKLAVVSAQRTAREEGQKKAKASRLAALKAAADAPGASRMAKRAYSSAAQSGMYAEGGKVSPERILARAQSGMKCGGKVKTSSDTARKLATEMGGMMDGGGVRDAIASKLAAGGAGKTRKGQAPIKKAQGGAAKVRKGMVSQSGDIQQAVKPKKGIGGIM